MEGCVLTTKGLLKMPQKSSPYSPMNLTPRVRFTFHYRNPSRRIRSLYNDLGAHTHNPIGGSQTMPELSQLEVFATPPNRLGYTMHPKDTSSWEHNAPKSNKLTTFTSTNPCGEHKPMHQMQWKEHKCSNPSLSNFNKVTNAYGGIRDEEQGRTQQMNHKI